jgi:hypothetical protein
MHDPNDPRLLDALQRIFPTRDELRTIAEYQQRLFASLQELDKSHRAVHEHVRNLTESHNRVQNDSGNNLSQIRGEMADSLRNLDSTHRQTREEIRRAIDTLTYIQQEIRKIPSLENRLNQLERDMERFRQDDRSDDRKVNEQEQRLRKLERR